jgi:hypothetical protein
MFAPTLALIRARIDRLGIFVSALCLVHCVSSVVLVTLLGIGGGILLDPRVHQIGLAVAIGVGAMGLGFGVMRHGRRGPLLMGAAGLGLMALGLIVPHGFAEALVTAPGVALLALAHMRNLRHSA